ncbi:MAG: SGNH/GDSL hydrolase family protein [Phycisphaeraceae bacterium]|nr:SGNH/GDSL hydrolase family protein [Phycisphaeraceae bacterium]
MMFQPKSVVLFQGDSITDAGRNRDVAKVDPQSLAALGNGYAMLTASQLLVRLADHDLTIHNRGIGGNRVPDLRDRWQVDCIDLKPNLVSILIGVNDTWHGYINGGNKGVPVNEYEQIYRRLLDWTVSALPGVKLVLGEPFTFRCGKVTAAWEPEMSQRVQVVRELANDFGARLVPFQTEIDRILPKVSGEYWSTDGVHPTLAGHALLAKIWLDAMWG